MLASAATVTSGPTVCHFRQNRMYRRGKVWRSFATS
jgi:hypothetical protein